MYNNCLIGVEKVNRKGRSKLKNAAEKFNRESNQAIATFISVLEDLKNEEQEKLDNLSEQLVLSVKGEQIEESMESLDNLLDGTAEMRDALENLLSEQGLNFSFAPVVESDRRESKGRSRIQFHAVLPDILLDRLRRKSKNTGISMNEIVCRTLSKGLLNESI